jgi:hypothetical protein
MEKQIKIIDTINSSTLFKSIFSFVNTEINNEKTNMFFVFCKPDEIDSIVQTVGDDKAIILCSYVDPIRYENLAKKYNKTHFFFLTSFSYLGTNVAKHAAIALGNYKNSNSVLNEYYRFEIQDIIIFAKNSKIINCLGVYFTDIKTAIVFNDFLNSYSILLEQANDTLRINNCNMTEFEEMNNIILKDKA